jgi:hypothetical protein
MNGQSRETSNIEYTRKTKQKTQRNALDMHHYTQTNKNNVDKTWALLQTIDSKDEPNIVFPDSALVNNFGISVLYHKWPRICSVLSGLW